MTFAGPHCLFLCISPLPHAPSFLSTQDAVDNGDTLVRVMLSTLSLQPLLAPPLLQQLPQLCNSPAAHQDQSLLLLGQLKWLERVADARLLADCLLEVLPSVHAEAGAAIAGLIPEIIAPGQLQVRD